MKMIHIITALLVSWSICLLAGCANTANGIHNDWREDTQKIANSTGN